MASDRLGRRYLKTREYVWVQVLAKWIASLKITPNQISILSVFSSLAASLCLLYINNEVKWLVAVLFIQFRLFCNMMDGLVAIECNQRSRLGDIYNELPDRISDVLIIIALGYSLNSTGNFVHSLSYTAAILAVFTAYVRLLFTSIGAPADYSGPMAKQHRMFTICIACLLLYFSSLDNIILYSFIILNFGMVITIIRRIRVGVNNIS